MVDGERPSSARTRVTGVVPDPICWAHEIVEPPGGVGEIVNWQPLSGVAFGLTVPLSVAPENVTALAAAVVAVGAGSVQVSVICGSAPVSVGSSESPLTPAGPGGSVEAPPPAPPPPAP